MNTVFWESLVTENEKYLIPTKAAISDKQPSELWKLLPKRCGKAARLCLYIVSGLLTPPFP
jgi:hypothetical protein